MQDTEHGEQDHLRNPDDDNDELLTYFLQMGNFIHYMATFVAGFAVGFTSLWKLALVTLAVVPLIAIAGGFYAACLTEHTARTQQQYWEAGSIVEQVPGSSLHIKILDPLY